MHSNIFDHAQIYKSTKKNLIFDSDRVQKILNRVIKKIERGQKRFDLADGIGIMGCPRLWQITMIF